MQNLLLIVFFSVAGALIYFTCNFFLKKEKFSFWRSASSHAVVEELDKEDDIHRPAPHPAQAQADDFSMELDDLRWLLDKKKTDLLQLKTAHQLKEENAVKLDALEETIDVLEHRLNGLQEKLYLVRTTAIALDELSVTCARLQQELTQSQHQLQYFTEENELLRQQLEETTEYGAEMKLQKQQLQKKAKLLEDLYTSLLSASAASGQR